MLRLLHEQSTTTASNTIKYVVQHWNFGLKTLKSQQMLIVHIIVQKGILFNLVKKSIFFKSQTLKPQTSKNWGVMWVEKSEKFF